MLMSMHNSSSYQLYIHFVYSVTYRIKSISTLLSVKHMHVQPPAALDKKYLDEHISLHICCLHDTYIIYALS